MAGLLGAYQLTKRLELLAEIRSASDKLLNGGDLIANFGLRLEMTPRFILLAAAGTGLPAGPDTTRFVGYLGVQFATRKPAEAQWGGAPPEEPGGT